MLQESEARSFHHALVTIDDDEGKEVSATSRKYWHRALTDRLRMSPDHKYEHEWLEKYD
jgi:hypothetical protein